jgi:hypothetical protein
MEDNGLDVKSFSSMESTTQGLVSKRLNKGIGHFFIQAKHNHPVF